MGLLGDYIGSMTINLSGAFGSAWIWTWFCLGLWSYDCLLILYVVTEVLLSAVSKVFSVVARTIWVIAWLQAHLQQTKVW